MRSVALLLIGDELLSGEITDQNGPFLLQHLRERGLRLERLVVAPDDRTTIQAELRRLRDGADVVVISGGIGPTHDDVTRPALAQVLGRALVRHPEAERRIRGFYGEGATSSELDMADLPEGAVLTDGVKTDTFGFAVEGFYAFPGVPFLFRDLVRGMDAVFGRCALHRVEIRTPRREGEIAPVLSATQAAREDVSIGSYPVFEEGTWHVRVVLRGEDAAQVEGVAASLRATLDA